MANETARTLRRNQTNAERTLWRAIRRKQVNGYSIRRQHPLGEYIADFICLEKKLIVEVDGGHHADDAQMEHDNKRDDWQRSRGFRVVRYWNTDIFNNLEGVLIELSNYLYDPGFGPPPP